MLYIVHVLFGIFVILFYIFELRHFYERKFFYKNENYVGIPTEEFVEQHLTIGVLLIVILFSFLPISNITILMYTLIEMHENKPKKYSNAWRSFVFKNKKACVKFRNFFNKQIF